MASTPSEKTEEVVEKPVRHMTFDEWFAWAPDSRITEWVDGEVIELSPIHEKHDSIFRWLIVVLELFLEEQPLGVLRTAPFVLKLTESRRGREPDLMFIAVGQEDRIHPTYIEGPVDAVWEIISPESAERDRNDKFLEYQKEGISEYWLIDPHQERLELYHLDENGKYQAVALCEGKLKSSAIKGFYLRPEWLWMDPKPRSLDVLHEMKVL